jgi:aryl-alcohol dehydrogenase-like predicted oxidoreductase
MLAYCKFNGIGVIPWAPLAAGDLARPFGTVSDSARRLASKGTPDENSEADKAIIGRVQELAEKRGWKMSQVALAWISTKVASPIVGVSSVQRLEESLTTGLELDENEIKYLEEP